jgi:acetolactate synthase I/II/III large subunit
MGLGAYPGDGELFLGMPGMHGSVTANYALTEADLIIAAGVRFDDRVTGKLEAFANHAKIVHIDIDPAEIGKNIKIDIPIVGDVRLVLEELMRKLRPGNTAKWLKQIAAWQKDYPMPLGMTNTATLKPQFVIRELSRLSGENTIVATDVGQHQMWSAQHFIVREPNTFLTSGGLGTMGYGFPAAIGARLAAPDKKVICITGDGSFQMNIQELTTVVHNKLDMTIALINNGYLGMVRQWQDIFYDKALFAHADGGEPRFCQSGRGFRPESDEGDQRSGSNRSHRAGAEVEGPGIDRLCCRP